ncbi:zinc finger CCCH domain-containing protein 39-like [Pyrus communis]|uniref:zinc finger CCCH domain-containing protein 39-like n=1 Tax=Pyrus communis TaxID=23211 RepID=UPI0035C0BB78
MSTPLPTQQFFARYLESVDNGRQIKHQIPTEEKEIKAQSDIKSQAFKKPRTSEAVSNSNAASGQNKMLPSYYKTKLCRKFQMGCCSSGQRCSFAHGTSDLRRTLRDAQGMETEKGNLARMTWNGDHGSSNGVRICRSFFRWGTCSYGDKCRFRHVNPENIRDSSFISISTAGGSAQFDCKKSLELRKLCGYTTPECGSVQANSLMTYTRGNNVSNRRMGVATAYKHGQSTQCNLEWNELEKLSRIYADWIEDMPLLHGSSSKVECYSSLV